MTPTLGKNLDDLSKKISAVICTYNRYDLLPKAIESCEQQRLMPEDFEIIVVDNSPNSSEMSRNVAKYKGHVNIRYVIEPTPGLSNARNAGVSLARSPFVAFLDDDAIAGPDWLGEVLNAFQQFGDKAAIVGGRIDPIWTAPRPPWLSDEMLGMLTVVNYGGENRVAKPEEWLAGANISFRASALEAAGGFDVSLGRRSSAAVLLSNEENSVIRRLKQEGFKAIYAPNAKVEHLVDESRLEQKWIRRRQAWQAVSDFLTVPERFENKEDAYWGVVSRYYSKVKPRLRTAAGLFSETDDPDIFRDQVRATYCMTALILMGCADADSLNLKV